MKKFDYFQPENLEKAYELMEKYKSSARYVAGGTDILLRIKQKVIQPDALISLTGIKTLRKIDHNGGLSLGSLATFKDISKDIDIFQNYPALAKAAAVVADPSVRNVATVGGNICNAAPSADSVPPLMVMEAKLILAGPGGEKTVPIEDFFTGPGENVLKDIQILKEIRIPKKAPNTRMAFQKVGRVKQDIAVVNAAVLMVMDGKFCQKCRLSVGAVAPVPLRLKNVEKILEGEEVNQILLDRVKAMVEQEVRPITDLRSTEDYRREVSGVLIRRAIVEAIK